MIGSADLKLRAEALMIGGLVDDTSAELQLLTFTLYRLLAQRRPVERQLLAPASGLASAETDALLAEIPASALVWQNDAIVAYGGLDLRPSDHLFEVGGEAFYTWCVFDGLFLPEIIGQSAKITTRCPATDTVIEVEVAPDALLSCQPAEPVMSIVAPEVAACAADLRGAFCRHVRFFATGQDFADWAGDRPDVAGLSLAQAHDLAGRRNAQRFAALA